jgi:hypothetical protein
MERFMKGDFYVEYLFMPPPPPSEYVIRKRGPGVYLKAL